MGCFLPTGDMGLDTVGGQISTIRVASFAHSLVASIPPSYLEPTYGETEGMAEAKRKLLAILAADVVGYSRLMEADESGTLAQLKALRKELIELDPKRTSSVKN